MPVARLALPATVAVAMALGGAVLAPGASASTGGHHRHHHRTGHHRTGHHRTGHHRTGHHRTGHQRSLRQAAPPAVHGLRTSVTDVSATLHWTPPRVSSYTRVVARWSRGSGAPARVTAGHPARLAAARATSATIAALTPGTRYAVAVWTVHHGVTSRASRALVVTRALPAAPTGVHATGLTPTTVQLAFRRPASPDLGGVLVRRAAGTQPPTSTSAGTRVADLPASSAATVDTLPGSGTWSYALFAHDRDGHFARAVTATVTTDAHTAVAPAVQGTVTDAAAPGVPLAGVLVSAAADLGDDPDATATTDADGFYTVRGLSAGASYVVCFDASGVTSGAASGYLPDCLADRVPTSAAAVTAGIDDALSVAGGVHGLVTTRSGAALDGVAVTAYDGSDPVASTDTAADGSYALTGLRPGDYTVCLAPDADSAASGAAPAGGWLAQCGGRPWDGDEADLPADATPVTVAAGTLAELSAVLDDGAGIAGRALGGSPGTALSGATVSVFDAASGADVADTVTGTDGRYAVRGLPPTASGYAVCIAPAPDTPAPGWVAACLGGVPWDGGPDLPAGATALTPSSGTASAAPDVTLARGAGFTGSVTGPDGGVGGVWVTAQRADGSAVGYAFTDADGTWTIGGLPASASGYRVCFDASSADDGTGASFASQCSAGVAWDGNSAPPGSARAVPATAGAVTTHVGAVLTVSG